MIKTFCASALALLLTGPAAAAPADPAAAIREVETGLSPAVQVKGQAPARRTIYERMAADHVPGVSLAVIDHGQVVSMKAYGVVTAGGTSAVTPGTRFQAASISKTLAAATALSLVVEGKADLDAPVNSELKGWTVPPSDLAPGYAPSLRALLSHSGGISVHGFAGYAVGTPIPTLIQVLEGAKPANSAPILIDHKPGVWQYSGGGTTIVQKLIEDVTGRPFPEAVKARVIGPVGMSLSTYAIPDQADQSFATAHKSDGRPIPGRWHIYPEQAAAGLWTTPGDLARWALAVARAAKGDPGGGVDPRVAKLLLEPQPGLDTGSGAMGIGFFLNPKGAPASFGHGGANEGFRSQLIYYPETGQGVAIMTNSDTGGALQEEIQRTLASVYGWPVGATREVTPVQGDPAVMRALAGAYALQSLRNAIVLTLSEGGLRAAYWDGQTEPLVAIAPDSFIGLETGRTFSAAPGGGLLMQSDGMGKITLQRSS
jgi:CubicO group peptidase (beta-lactamase class C family)